MDSQPDSFPPSSRGALLLCLLFTLIAALLAASNLDNIHFWDDEAYTGLFTKNFLQSGSFSGWDGRNLVSFRQGTLLNSNLESINPPLAYFVCAAGFKLLGYTTAAGRLPFAILGLLSIPATFFLTRTLFPRRPHAAIFAIAYLALSVSFLLYIKQCRYYSPVITFSTLTLLSYFLALRSRKLGWSISLAFFATLLFYAHYMVGIATIVSLGMVFLIFHARDLPRRQWLQLSLSGALYCLLVLPYAVIQRIWVRPDFAKPPFSQKLELLWWNLRELNTCAWLPWMIVVLGLVLIIIAIAIRARKRESLSSLTELGVLFLTYLVVATVLSPQDLRKTAFADTRYLVALIPLCAALVGFFLNLVQSLIPHKRAGQSVAWAILVLSVCTNCLTLTPKGITPGDFTSNPLYLLPAYIAEITNPYPEPYRAASTFILENLPEDATVLAFPDYFNYPLMFYTGHHVLFRGLIVEDEMKRRNPNLPIEKIQELDPRLFADRHAPDYILAFGLSQQFVEFVNALIRRHGIAPGASQPSFNYQQIQTLDVFAHSTIRPELFWRRFRPVNDFDRKTKGVFIFKKTPVPQTPGQ